MRKRLVALCLLGLAALSDGVDPVEGQMRRLTSIEAGQHLGEVATVCGVVSDYQCHSDGTTFMLDVAGSRPTFQIVIPRSERGGFDARLEDRLKAKRVCATGLIEDGKMLNQMVVTEPVALALENGGPLPPPAFAPDAYHSCSANTLLPKVTRNVKPRYTRQALGAGIQGVVRLEAVVEPNGSVGATRVTGSLDAGLDLEAIAALKHWRFEPGTHEGRAVPFVINVELSFTIRP